jgi:DNA-directed RNA polymerase specialized sigma subunit
MNATEFLEQVRDADAEVDRLRADERELWRIATSMTQANDGMPHATGVSDKVGNIIQKIIAAQDRINAQIDRYIDIRDGVIKHLDMLPKKQRRVLHWFYVRKREHRKKNQQWYYTWREVAENIGCSEQNVYNLRKKGLRNLQKILDAEKKMAKVD